ncbi:MAG: tetratricopeptide repeat protein [Bacteroidetes bacterium]|nr:MAG: tetratricopeptide repeat protein [Bacteroidota bacterium]
MNEHIAAHIQKGNQYFAAYRFEEAHSEYSRALYELQQAGLALNEAAQAELHLMRATALASADEQAALSDPDIFNQIIDDYDNAIDLRPEALHYRNLRGRMYMNCRFVDYKEEAEKDFEFVLKQNPHEPDALNMMGLLAAEQQDMDRAIYYFSLAIEQEPSADLYASRGMCYFRRMPPAYEVASREFAKALELDPKREDLYLWRAHCFIELGEEAAALQTYDQLIELAPRAEYFVDRGQTRLTSELEQARNDFLTAIEMGQHPLAYNNLAWMLAQEGEYEQAVQHAETALQLDPTCTIAYATLAEIYALQGKEDAMYEHLALALQHFYDDYLDVMAEPAFQPYLQQQRFQQLISEMKQRQG